VGDSQSRRLEELLARELARALALIALALIQVAWLSLPLGFPLPLLLVLVVNRVIIGVASAFPDRELGYALRWAIYGGLTLDLLAATPLGAHVLALLLAALVVMLFTRRLRVGGPLIPLLAVLVATPIYELTLALLTQPLPLEWVRYGQFIILPVLLMALILTLPTYLSLRWLLSEPQERG
jgi:cell shape-determining protein MreD